MKYYSGGGWGGGGHIDLRHGFPHLSKLGVKQVGPSGPRQTGLCMDHSSYHRHTPAHLLII
jgi:hypothetical protein